MTVDGAHDHPLIAADIVTALGPLEDRLTALEARVAALTPVVVPPPVIAPPPTVTGIGSAWVDTKDNIQMRRNGNGDVAIRLRKRGTGPITGVRIQDRFGTSSQVYHKGTGGTYRVSVTLGSPDGAAIASTTWQPVSPGADAGFPTIMFDAPSVSVPDGTTFYVVFVNIHASPDANYCSMNVLHIFGGFPSPRQPTVPDAELAVLVNTGSGWVDRGQTPTIDVLPSHEGFAYAQCNQEMFKTISGTSQVRQTLPTGGTFGTVKVRVRRKSGTGLLTVSLEDGAGGLVASATIPAAQIPITTSGGDTGGQAIGTATFAIPATITSGYLRLSCAAGTVYTASPVRKSLKGAWPTLTSDWGSAMAPGHMEFTTGGAWQSVYGSPPQMDLQFGLLP